jgi:hypothetical protein
VLNERSRECTPVGGQRGIDGAGRSVPDGGTPADPAGNPVPPRP